MHHWNSPFFDPSLHHTTLAIQILLLVCKNCGFIIHGLYDRMPLEDSKSHLQFAFLPPSAQPIIQQTTLLGSNERKTEVPYLLPSYFCKKKIVVCLKGVKGVLVLNSKNALLGIEGPITNRLLDDLLAFNETVFYLAHGPIHLISLDKYIYSQGIKGVCT